MSSRFRAAVEALDLDAMREALHPDVVFRSPAVFKPYEGRDAVMPLLDAISRVLEDFHYLDELSGDGSEALIFVARVGDRELHGLDYLRVDEEGLVTELWVMIRPASGLMAAVQGMQRELGGASAA